MNRRAFLRNSAVLLAGTTLGLGCYPSPSIANIIDPFAGPVPRIALIIDDIGYSRPPLRQFLKLDVPITFSVLPRLNLSSELAMEIHENGHDVMLHQPMEPFDSTLHPGPGALYVGSEAERIHDIVQNNILDVPYASGVNNHMGSRYTSTFRDIAAALSAIKSSGLFFIDSLTTGRSVAYKTARRMKMAASQRNIFLDNIPQTSTVFRQLLNLKKCAERYGSAIGIGHPHPETARGIRRFLEQNRTVRMVPISDVII